MNWILFVEERIWHPLRKARMRAWIHALLAPVKTMHSMFLVFKANVETDLTITPQVRILRHWLNMLFDLTEKRIVIEDYVAQNPVYLPMFLPEFLSGSEYDFVVKCPCQLVGQKVSIRSFLDKYKLAGMRYELRFVDEDDNPCIALEDE